MGPQSLLIVLLLQCEGFTIDVYRRQILATKVDPRAVKNPYPAKLSYLNFHPLAVESRFCDPQFQVAENH